MAHLYLLQVSKSDSDLRNFHNWRVGKIYHITGFTIYMSPLRHLYTIILSPLAGDVSLDRPEKMPSEAVFIPSSAPRNRDIDFSKKMSFDKEKIWYACEVWHRPWKMLVGKQLSYWKGDFSGAMLNLGKVMLDFWRWYVSQMAKQSVDLSWGREASFYPSDADPPKNWCEYKRDSTPCFCQI